jgi:hypothetical protein
MVVSRCHKKEVYIIHDYYVCSVCNIPCATMNLSFANKDVVNDARKQAET